MRLTILCAIANILLFLNCKAQVDTSLLFNTHTPFGRLDIRLSKGNGHVYYLQEGKTFSFRGTNTYLEMMAWDSSPYGQGNMRERNGNSDAFVMNYRLLQPQDYDSSFEDGYPLVVVMHGFLERGNCAEENCYHAGRAYSPNENLPPAPTDPNHKLLNNDYNLVHAGSNYLEAHRASGSHLPNDPTLPARAFPGFVIFPQNLNGWDGRSAEDVIRLLRLLMKKYNIDEDRVYINAVSHGGHGAYELMKRAPWMFAAAALFSSADDASVIQQNMAAAIAHIPLWIFQGALDTQPSPAKTENYIEAFRKAGALVRYSLYPNLAHGTWNKALAEPDFFTWMLSKRRNSIHVSGGHTAICSTSAGTLLSLPAGFKSYEWEFNGSVIEGEAKNTYTADAPGRYRGRFLIYATGSPDHWSNWSESLELSAQTVEPPVINQIGTLLLPDLNGNQSAILESASHHAYYYWQKDTKSINSAAKEDSLRRVTLQPDLGSGSYSLIVADYDKCKSEPSISKQIVFNNKAPMTLGAPFNVKAEVTSPSQVTLEWSDTTHNESGFEIWRRKVGSHADALWHMATLTKKDITTFVDNGLEPSSTYEYKIRSVNQSERSDYVPVASGTLTASTSADTELPSPPGQLSSRQEGATSIRLTWRSSHDNSSVLKYIVFYNDDSLHMASNDTTYLLSALDVNMVYSFSVRAVDLAGNVSEPSNVVEDDTFFAGLWYTHSTGAWQILSEVDWSIAEYSGVVKNFTLAPKTQEDFYNFMFDGFLAIDEAGTYQFRVTSDDASNLTLNDSLLIENDGIHQINTVTGPIQILDRGPQRITVKYFDYVEEDTLLVEYKGPDTGDQWVRVPDDALASNIVSSTRNSESEGLYLAVYPNPATLGNIHVTLRSPINEPIVLRIFDVSGNELYNAIMDFNVNIDINLSDHMKQGMYIISVTQRNQVLNKKVFIR